MTFPKTLKSIKILTAAQALSFVSEVLTIAAAGISISSPILFSDDFQQIPVDMLLLMAVLTGLFLICGVCASILYLIGTHKASAEDTNFKVAFYSTIITLFLSVMSIVFSANKEVENITGLLMILTELLAKVYILEGIRSLCKQLGHPEMDKQGGYLYAFITTIFVFQTCVSVYILVLGGSMATVGASWLAILGSAMSIIGMILLFVYYARTIRILSKE